MSTESLHWHRVEDAMPDADESVILWYLEPGHAADWTMGWWDGHAWHDSTGWPMVVGSNTVTHWARPSGPDA